MKTVTETLKINGMHCTSCAINIDFELEDLEGVQESKTHYAKQVSIVKIDPTIVNKKQIVTAIAKLGYKAIVIK